jgi:S1-C subfamily serine protease
MQPVHLPEAFARGLGLSRDTGLIVVNVEADGPAARAGLLIGDVLVALDDMPVGDTDDVQHLLGPRRIGAAITLSLVRAGALVRIPMTVGERPQRRRR